jgi:hypothetical protein
MTSEQYRWRLVDDFVVAFNDHRVAMFVPSEQICAHESISRWYGQGQGVLDQHRAAHVHCYRLQAREWLQNPEQRLWKEWNHDEIETCEDYE